jgi:hypothetical protein
VKPPKIIDAEFRVVSGPRPRWDPFRGLGTAGRLVAGALTLLVLVWLGSVVEPIMSALTSALLG